MAQPSSLLQAASVAAACLLLSGLARAEIDIDIQGVEDGLRDNVLAYLSFERYRRGPGLSADTVERLHNRVEREVTAALRPFGYYEPQVRSELSHLGGDDWRVAIRIDPGRPIIMQDVDVQVRGPGADDEPFVRIVSRLPLRPGDRLSHAAYDQVKSELQRAAATYGYLDARLLRNELRVDPKSHLASAVIEFETGPRYRFGATRIEQDVVDEVLLRRFIRYREGEPFDLTELLRTQFALDDSQYFTTVEVLPGEPDRDTHVVPITIQAEANRRNRYSFGVGYVTDTGARGTATWENRRVNTHGHRFNTELRAASPEQTLDLRYIVPIGDPALEKFTVLLSAEQRELADLDTANVALEPSITRIRGRWQNVWFVTATRVETETPLERRIDTLFIPGVSLASIPQGYLGEALFVREYYAEIRGSHSAFGSDSDFIQARLQVERVFDLSPVWHLQLRGEIGASLVAEFSELPGPVRFFAGGDRSVRGFGYNELSPVETVTERDADGEPVLDAQGNPLTRTAKVGGKHLLTGTVEIVRDLPRQLGVAAFFDFGNAFDRFGDPLEYSVGLGFRWRLPVVTVGIDVAQPLSQDGAGPRLHLNFSPKL